MSVQYVLFRVAVHEKSPTIVGLISWGNFFTEDVGEEWKNEQHGDAKKTETLEFVCKVSSPRDVAKEVRKSPLDRYVLFRGEISPIKIAMPVFVGGKNLDTFDKEWATK